MDEFVKKLIERLEELITDSYYRSVDGNRSAGIENGAYHNVKAVIEALAEEYNNDFCEWKKTDKSKYSPYYHALKHGNITLEFHDDFKFCPYCGKKIKVAPYTEGESR